MLFSYFSSRVEDHHLPQRHSLSSSHHFFFLSFHFCSPTFVPSRCHHSQAVPLCADTPSLPLATPPAASEQIPAGTLLVQPTQKSSKESKNLCSFPSSPTKRDILRWMGSTFITCSLEKKITQTCFTLTLGLQAPLIIYP